MPTLAQIAIFLAIGLAGGFAFFGVLDRVNARLARKAEEDGANVTGAIAATLVVRIVLLGAMLFAALRTGIGTMLATFLGFIIARAVCLHLSAKPADGQEQD